MQSQNLSTPVAMVLCVTNHNTFDFQGGGNVTGVTDVSSGSKITVPANPARTGYMFGGWYTDKNCTTAWDYDKDTVTSNITLYAK